MPSQRLLLLLLLFSFSVLLSLSQLSALPALPSLPQPDAAPIPVQLGPAVNSGAPGAGGGGASQATIPAFPEQSDAASTSSCPLDLPADLLPSVSAACSTSGDAGHSRLPSHARCCPVLAAWLYAGYSASSLAARPVSSAAAAVGYDLPALPDDSESCVAGAERALRSRGVALPRLNGTCDAAYCYCGVRLRRLTCAGGAFVADAAQGRWVPAASGGRRLERDCALPGLSGCNRCLRSLNQLKAKEKKEDADDAAVSERRRRGSGVHDRECQLMGVTWLLSKNRTKYLPAATSVLRVLMAADEVGSSDPTSCALSQGEMPLAVASSQINGADGSSTLRPLASSLLFLALITISFLRSTCL